VAKSLSIEQLKKLAAHGARARVEELRAEIAAITSAFPNINAADGGDGRRGRGAGGGGPRRRRRRGTLSAAGRAAISAAQKKRWAAVKRKKGASSAKPDAK